MNEMIVADAAQRARALDTTTSFIVQAPAGSGKTELITQRFLALLGRVKHPEEIIAITFTRKAAAEMRGRIIGALEAAAGEPPGEPHRRKTWDLARAALAQDEREAWRISESPNRLRIQTFDSLSHVLARQMPLLSELGAAPATTERAEPLYREAARATLRMLDSRQSGDDIAALLTHLDNRRARLEDLLTGMLARRDQWLSHALANPDGDTLNDALEQSVCDRLRQLRQGCRPDWLHQLVVLAGQIETASGHAKPVVSPALPDARWSDLEHWQRLGNLLLTSSGTLRKRWTAREGFPAPSERGIDSDEKARRQQAKTTISELSNGLAENSALLDRWAMLRRLPAQGLDSGQQGVLNSLLRTLLHAAVELQLVFQQSGEVDFAEVQMRAQRALGSPDEPTDLALSLDYRLQHLLIDEFQDTSSSQYRLLETLTAGWQPEDGRTLFAVGDPMQSIYRFREAEVGNYLHVRDHGIGQIRPDALHLSVNFRSTSAIVGWLNGAFPSILAPAVDIARGAVPYSPAVASGIDDDPDAVQIHPFAGKQSAEEAALVVDLVRQALTRLPTGKVAILARARSHLGEIAVALQHAGIVFQAVDINPLARQPVVQDLYALTRALLHPGDRLSWLVVLRAPWLGLDMADLAILAADRDRCIPMQLHSTDLVAALSADGQRRVARLLAVIDDRWPIRGRLPLRQVVEGTWLALGGLALAGRGGAADAQAYLNLLEQHATARGIDDFARLGQSLDDLYAAADAADDDRVQLMTMHKAKGLEFDTVILPGLGRPPRTSDSELLYWLEQVDEHGERQLLMAPIRASEQAAEPISQYLRELDKEKQGLETGRLLYVAATRARSRLHLLGHLAVTAKGLADQPPRDSLLGKLWPAVNTAFADLGLPTDSTPAPAPAMLSTLPRLAADWQPSIGHEDTPAISDMAALSDKPVEFAWAGDTARHVGTLVHRYLERIARQGIEHWPVERVETLGNSLSRGLLNLGVEQDELAPAAEKAARALRDTLGDDKGRWILTRHEDSRCEWPLTLHADGPRHYIIDRSFIDENGIRWIIDYKTGEHLDGDHAAFLDQEQERYREQLETYGRLVHLLEDRPIRLALYFPLFADWRVWDFQP